MCGIIGYVGLQAAGPILLEGLHRLEYRGYDSSGIAVLNHAGVLAVHKRAGKLADLTASIEEPPDGCIGLGHTRWATHGAATDRNAHPHTSSAGDVVVVHNGIVENFRELRSRLQRSGIETVTQTDTEVIPQLISLYQQEGCDFPTALRRTMAVLRGGNAVVALTQDRPDHLYVARNGHAGGVVLGFGEGEMFVASDLPALLPHTTRIRHLADGEIAAVTAEGARIWDRSGATVPIEPLQVDLDPVAAMKGQYRHFMLKEIMEQPRTLSDTIRGRARIDPPSVELADLPMDDEALRALRRVLIVGMGSSLHAAMIGRTYMERLAGIPADFDNASEFRSREPLLGPETLVVSISQSGETVDTLAAMQQVAEIWKAPQVTVCNVEGAQSTRITDGAAIYLRCGPEIGVASTKCFTASLAALYLLACRIGIARGHLDGPTAEHALECLLAAPSIVDRMLDQREAYEELAARFAEAEHMLYIARGIQYPIAMEGALKCKEISYIHAEGYPAGELKHGPIALIDRRVPVVAIALRDALYEKLVSNIQQVQARGGTVFAIGSAGDEQLAAGADFFIPVPESDPLVAPLATAIPAQLIAYHLALARGADIDQPRHLAKTVTVE